MGEKLCTLQYHILKTCRDKPTSLEYFLMHVEIKWDYIYDLGLLTGGITRIG